VNLIQVINV